MPLVSSLVARKKTHVNLLESSVTT
ncbi:hypothetical protein Tco_1581107, partial [Tanacetum coccineum]